MTSQNRRILLWLVITAVVMSYLLLSGLIAAARSPYIDEALLFSPALNLITKGHMGTSILDETSAWRDGMSLKGINRHTYQVLPMHFLFQAGWYRIVGAGLFQMRMLSVFWGLLALAAWFVIIRSLGRNLPLAILASGLLALDNTFLVSSAFGRADMASASLGYLALAAYLLLRERDLLLAIFTSHSLAAAGIFTHPVAMVHLFNLLFLVAYFDRRNLRIRHFFAAAIPYAVFTAGWAAYVLQNPSVFWEQFRTNASGRVILQAPWTMVSRELGQRYLPEFGFGPNPSAASRLKLYLLLTFVASLAAGVAIRGLRRHRGFRALLAINGIAFFAMVFFEGTKQGFYLVHLIPLHSAALAVCVWWLWTANKVPRYMLAVPLSLFLSLQLARTAHVLKMDTYRQQYLPVVRFLERDFRAGKLIMGDAILAFGLGFSDNIVDDLRLGYYTHKSADITVVNDRYREWFGRLRRREPAVYSYVADLLLAKCERVYHAESFTVYRRRDSTQDTHVVESSQGIRGVEFE